MSGRIIQCFIYLRNGSAHDNHCEHVSQAHTHTSTCSHTPLLVHTSFVHGCHLRQSFMVGGRRCVSTPCAFCFGCALREPLVMAPADAHPLDLLVFLDMNSGRILETQMQPSPPVIPQMNFNYLAGLVHQERGTRTGTPLTAVLAPWFLVPALKLQCLLPVSMRLSASVPSVHAAGMLRQPIHAADPIMSCACLCCRCQAAERGAAGGAQLCREWQRGGLAEMELPRVLQLPRGPGAAQRRVRMHASRQFFSQAYSAAAAFQC